MKQRSHTSMHGGNQTIDRRLCVAPMMDWTDRHCRLFHRLIAPSAFRFTEMVTAEAILHGDKDRLLAQAALDMDGAAPVALQLGGSDPGRLAAAVAAAAFCAAACAALERFLPCFAFFLVPIEVSSSDWLARQRSCSG